MTSKGQNVIVATALLWAGATPLAAQETVGTPPPPAAGWSVPKAAWGDPDLRGIYPLDQVGRTPTQRRPQHGYRLLMTDEEYTQALKDATEAEAGGVIERSGS